jgi:hypothetical protein
MACVRILADDLSGAAGTAKCRTCSLHAGLAGETDKDTL